MKLQMFHRPWTMYEPYEKQFEIIAREGYDSIEANLPEKKDFALFKKLLDEYHFDYIADVRSWGNTPEEHLTNLKQMLDDATELAPIKANAQCGRDFWDFDTQRRFFDALLPYEESLGYTVCHETHRSRCTFTPWTTARLLEEYPSLPLTTDISHWFCVTETLLEDFHPLLERIMQNAQHVHCRVGYRQGPQVPHPGAPEYQEELAAHEHWWRHAIRARAKAGDATFTCTPEYNYAGNRYIHTLPFTDVPVVDARKVCVWGMQRFRTLFAEEMNQINAQG